MAGATGAAEAGLAAVKIFRGVKPKPKSHHRQEQQQQLFAGLDSSAIKPPVAEAPLFHSGSPGKNKNPATPRANAGVGVIRAPRWSGEIDAGVGDAEVRHEIFPDWRSSRNGSILPAAGPLRSGTNVGTPTSRRPRNSCSDYRFPEDSVGFSAYGPGNSSEAKISRFPEDSVDFLASRPRDSCSEAKISRFPEDSVDFSAFGASMEDWSSLPGPGCGAGIDKTIYQNLVEMLPLMESFMEQKGNKRPFTRHASMVYTPNPVRETPVKKVAESPMKLKKNKQQRAGNGKVEESSVWEEQENILRRVEEDQQQQPQQQQYSEAQAVIEKLNREELIQLQDQIDGLKQQLWEKDSMLKTVRSYEMAELANQEQITELKARVDELQSLVREKDRVAQTIQSQLLEKQQRYGNVESMLDRVQQELLRKNEAASKLREELRELRVQMSAYEFQAELHKAKMSEEEDDLQEADDYSIQPEDEIMITPPKESKTVEAARKMYLGAVITAKIKPGIESIALAAEARKRLEAFLKHPFFRGAAASLPLI